MTTNIHDSGYKKPFSNHTIFRPLVETFIHEEWVAEVDFTHCETLDKSFVSDHYERDRKRPDLPGAGARQ